jgi:hypothetical protein
MKKPKIPSKLRSKIRKVKPKKILVKKEDISSIQQNNNKVVKIIHEDISKTTLKMTWHYDEGDLVQFTSDVVYFPIHFKQPLSINNKDIGVIVCEYQQVNEEYANHSKSENLFYIYTRGNIGLFSGSKIKKVDDIIGKIL